MSDKISGRNPVIEALRANRPINKIFLARGTTGSVKEIQALAKENNIIIQEVDSEKINSLAENRNHQGVVALLAARDYIEFEQLIALSKTKGESPLLILLDELEDPHNLGAIIRTVDAVGAHGVIIPKRRSVGLTEAVAKTSAGAVEYVPVARVSNLVQAMEYLKEQGFWIAGADATADQTYWQADLKGPMAIVIGSEGKGIGRLVRENCDFLVKIPLLGNISSLNASVSAALILYAWPAIKLFL